MSLKSLTSMPDKILVRLKDENNTILGEFSTRMSALEWADNLLGTITRSRFSLLGELNKIQADSIYEMKRRNQSTQFPGKDWIPITIVNLILKDYNVYIQETWNKNEGEDGEEE